MPDPISGNEALARRASLAGRTRCPTVDEIMLTVQQPERTNFCCKDHFFYMRHFDGVGLVVFAESRGDHNEILCADWLEEATPDA